MSNETNPWREAIEDAMICWEMTPAEGETPREALHRLLVMEQTAALDPAVSSEAARLVLKGRLEAYRMALMFLATGSEASRRVQALLESEASANGN